MTSKYEQAGRTATFEKELNGPEDIQALGDRVAQPVGIGSRRNELDAVSIAMQEKDADGESGFNSGFQSVVSSQEDVEAVTQRVVNTVAIAWDRGDVASVKVNVVELRVSDTDQNRSDTDE